MGKKLKNLVFLLLAVVMLMGLLCACGGTGNVSVEELAKNVDAALGKGDSLAAVDANYIKGYMKMDVADYDSYVVKINVYGANIDEYGIFKAKEGKQAKEVKAAVDNYLQLRLDSWMDEYMPEEKPKLTAAEVKTNGNYVMYCILSESDKSAAFGAFSDSIK